MNNVAKRPERPTRERGMMDIIGIVGYDLVSMTLITMQATAPNDSVPTAGVGEIKGGMARAEA